MAIEIDFLTRLKFEAFPFDGDAVLRLGECAHGEGCCASAGRAAVWLLMKGPLQRVHNRIFRHVADSALMHGWGALRISMLLRLRDDDYDDYLLRNRKTVLLFGDIFEILSINTGS